MKIYPESTLNEINDALDVRRLLELLDYQPGKIQESGDTIRGYCPIHRETVFRTLLLDKTRRSFRCMYGLCDGASGGSLVQLYALSKGIGVHEAATELVKQMGIEIRVPSDPQSIKKSIEVAENYYEMGYLDEARAAFNELVDAEPSCQPALEGLLNTCVAQNDAECQIKCRTTLARLFLQKKNANQAMEHARELVALSSGDAMAHMLLAECALESHDKELALDEYMAAADLHESLSDFGGAIEAFKRIEDLDLDIVDINPHLIQAFEQAGRTDDAIEHMAQKAERAAQETDYNQAAELLELVFGFDEARTDIRHRFVDFALMGSPLGQWITRVFEVVDGFLSAGRTQDAITALEKVRQQQPSNEPALERLFRCHLGADDHEKAAEVRVQSARIRRAAGADDAARAMLREALDLRPENDAALEMLADIEEAHYDHGAANAHLMRLASVLHQRGDLERAAGVLARILNSEPQSVDVRTRRAEILEQWGREGRSDALGEASLEWERLGDQFSDAMSGRSATEHLERAASLGPPRAALVSKLARAYFRTGEAPKARESIIAASKLLEDAGNMAAATMEIEYFAQFMPADQQIVTRFADLVHKSGRGDEAIHLLRDLAGKLAGRGELASAEAVLERATEYAPDDTDVLEQVAKLQLSKGEPDRSIATLWRIAELHEAGSEIDDAIRTVERIVERDSGGAPALERLVALCERAGRSLDAQIWRRELAAVHRANGDFDAEASALRKALLAVPDDEELLGLLVDCEFARGDRAEACAVARQRADYQVAAGRLSDARATLFSASSGAPEDMQTCGMLFELLSRPPVADEVLAEGIRLCELHMAAGDSAGAADTYQKIVDLYPDQVQVRRDQIEFLKRAGLGEARVDKTLELAGIHRERGDFADGEQLLQQALSEDPLSIRVRRALVAMLDASGDTQRREDQMRELAEAHHSLGEHDEAIAVVEGIIAENERSVAARRQLVRYLEEADRPAVAAAALHSIANLLRAEGDQREALGAERDAVRLMPADLSARRRMIAALEALGETEEAASEAEHVATVLAAEGRHEEALEALDRLAESHPNRLSARRMRTDLYTLLGDHESARQESSFVNSRSRLMQALELRAAEDHEGEAVALREALSHAPDDEGILYELVTCEFLRGDGAGGCVVARQLAAIQAAAGRESDARTTLAGALDQQPDDIDTVRDLYTLLEKGGFRDEAVARGLQLIDLLTAAGRAREAASIYDGVVRADPDNLRLRMNQVDFLRREGFADEALRRQIDLARVHEEGGRLDEAEFVYLQVLSSDPAFIDAHAALVSLHERQGDTQKMAERLRELADAHAARGDRDSAVAALRRAIAVQPDAPEARLQLVRMHRDAGLPDDAVLELHALADTYRRLENESSALDAEADAVAAAPASISAHRRYAEALLRNNELTRAVPEMEELASVMVDQGMHDDALATLDRVLEISPARPSCLVKKAEIFAAQGLQEKALEEYRKVSHSVASAQLAQLPSEASLPRADGFLKLVKDYDFEHFVVGTHNNFAQATARAVAGAPARAYNPLFLYSDVGLGKTHLVNAIANYMLRQDPRVRVIYTNSEDFTGELVNAIQTNSINAFRARYKSIDLLIVDDVQFLAGKERAQEEFFHIFNALFQAQRQIVVTSDRPPKDIAHLEARLRSRFGAGVIVDIAPPDLETRTAILNREIEANDLVIPPGIAAIIAERVDTNVRELKGALNQVVAMRALSGTEVTAEAVEKMLDNLYSHA